jgi:hypothetical protein
VREDFKMKNKLIWFAIFFVMAPAAFAQDQSPFLARISAEGAKYEGLLAAAEIKAMLQDGRRSAVNAKLKSLVPDNSKTAVDYLVLANILYRAEPQASDAYLKQAEALMPDEVSILYERGMHEQRNGHCDQALAYYDRVHATAWGKRNPVSWAYSTQCWLQLGDYEKAMQDWQQADFRKYHAAIETAMYEIFSRHDSENEREEKIGRAGTGSVDALCDLVDLDRHWESDWWNINTNEAYLQHDILIGKRLLAKDAAAMAAFSLCHEAGGLSPDQFRQRIVAASYWEGKYLLPAQPTLAYIVLDNVERKGLATPEEILQRYGTQLKARLEANPADKRTLDLLAHFYSATDRDEELAAIDEQGWKTQHLQNYAQSYMLGKATTGADIQAELALALAEFPNDAMLRQISLATRLDKSDMMREMMSYTAAQFANVRNHLEGPFRLNDYMASLKHEHDKRQKSGMQAKQ